MTRKPVLTSPDGELRIRSTDVSTDEINEPATQKLIADLIETMKLENGIGIAAPQIGVHKRIIIVDHGSAPSAYFNPTITSKSLSKVESEEGCLSVPGIFGIVKRHKSVTVEATNAHGEKETMRLHGLPAIVFQHEIDHLDGVLFIDKVIRYTSHPTL